MPDTYIGSIEELTHFGVKGMKWGVVKKDSSPAAQQRATEKTERREAKRVLKGDKFDARAAEAQQRIDKVKSDSYSRGRVMSTSSKQLVADLERDRDRLKKDANLAREGKLTSTQKKLLIGGVAAGTAVAAYATYKSADAGNFNRLGIKGKAFLDGNAEPGFKKNSNLAREVTDEFELMKIAAAVNPNYGNIGTKNNCRRATFAYEMRRRGYDVKATRTIDGTGQTVGGLFNAITPGQKVGTSIPSMLYKLGKNEQAKARGEKVDSFGDLLENGGYKNKVEPKLELYGKSIFDALGGQPNGARGELGMSWKMGGAHSMAWEIVNGKPVIIDTQNFTKYSSADAFQTMAAQMSAAGFTRLDDTELNMDYLMRWMRDA